KLYCAGALGEDVSASGYVYDPATDKWASIAEMPQPQAGGFYTAANGLLLVAGGFDSSHSITNVVQGYDSATDRWYTSLPNMNTAVARGAGICGFYRIGGITNISQS